MRPSFGCGLRRYLMAPNTLTTRTAMAEDIAAALTTWEPRIQVTNVAVTPDDNPTLVWIEISYVRLADRRPDNLVSGQCRAQCPSCQLSYTFLGLTESPAIAFIDLLMPRSSKLHL
jgi:hypothetical protein